MWKKIALMGVAGVAAVSLISALVPYLPNFLPKLFSSPESLTSLKIVPDEIADRISFGDKNLMPTEDSKNNSKFRDYKDRGIRAMAAGEYAEAVSLLEKALQSNPNAPETLIYLNNARIGDAEC